jgi:predicted ATPase
VSTRAILTPDQRLRVFVSSTLEELADERAAARRAIESLGLTPVMFERGARPHPPRSVYGAYLEQSHVFVGVYWQRYGWVGPDAEVSGLEDEYELSAALPRLVYVKEPAPDREGELTRLIARIESEAATSYTRFRTAAELEALVRSDLATLLTERFETATRAGVAVTAAPPAPTTQLIGRHDELATLEDLVTRADVRLVTLSGPGGVGKTRVAVELGTRLPDAFPGGVYFVPLETVDDPADVAAAIVRALDLRLAGSETERDAIRDFFHDRRSLLILDNFEQVREAAPLVADLLAGAAELRVLVTSRAALRIRGEHDFAVAPLEVPAGGGTARATEYDAVRLFVDRATAVRPEFSIDEANATAVAEICHRLDGLPLAIELVAAQIRVFAPDDLLARLGNRLDVVGGLSDAPERQQTLRRTIQWSYDLLSEDEKTLFARLGVFVGAFTLEAAEAVCDLPGIDVVGGLLALAEKSLIRADPTASRPAFRMLRTIRQFAVETLEGSGAAAETSEAHARFYVRRALDAHAGLRGRDQPVWQRELETEFENLDAAFKWWLDHGDPDTLADVGRGLWIFWFLRGTYLAEGKELMAGLLERGDLSAQGAARALAVRGFLTFWQGDFAAAVPDLESALDRFGKVGDQEGVAYALAMLGFVEMFVSGGEAGEDRAREAGELLASLGDHYGAAMFLNGLNWALMTHGRQLDSEEPYRAGLAAAEEIGNPQEIALAYGNLGRYHLYRGDPARAVPYLVASLEHVGRVRHDKIGIAYMLEALAEAALHEEDSVRAARLLGAADAIRAAVEVPPAPGARERNERNARLLAERLGDEGFHKAWSAGRSLPRDEAIAEALAVGARERVSS